MKTVSTARPQPEVGLKYWRGLDQLADTPEFRRWAESEFPAGASEMSDDCNRRDFVKIMSASFLLAGFGLTGCRRPVEQIIPFSQRPEDYVHGLPKYYATAMPSRNSAMPLVAKTHEGRPVKVEGNALSSDSNGSTDHYAQASVLNLYDPDRSTGFRQDQKAWDRESALAFLGETSKRFAESKGEGLYFLLEQSSSPSRRRLLEQVSKTLPKASVHAYEPLDFDLPRQAASTLSGLDVTPRYHLDKADIVLSMDCDFLGTEEGGTRQMRDFARRRKIKDPEDSLNRLYAVEGLMTLTGAAADHRLKVRNGQVIQVAAQIALEVMQQLGGEAPSWLAPLGALGPAEGVDPAWIKECARDLVGNAGKCLIMAGYRQPPAVHSIATALNLALGNQGKTLVMLPSTAPLEKPIAALAEALQGDQVDTLVIIGGNPVYNAPADLGWSELQQQAGLVIRLGYYEDETSLLASTHLPGTHYLESWGDARTSDGTVVAVQPMIKPLFNGLSELELLARLLGMADPTPYEIVRTTLREATGEEGFENRWSRFLHDGLLVDSATLPIYVKFDSAATTKVLQSATVPPLGDDEFEVVFSRDASLDDGRYNNNGWLQEFPDPITKITWDNAVLVSRKTAESLELNNGDVIGIKLAGRVVEGPIWVQPGLADKTLALALGYGRERSGRVGAYKGESVGFNAYSIRSSSAPYIATGASVYGSGGRHEIASTQEHWSMNGRAIVREANLEQFREYPDFVNNMDLEAKSNTEHLIRDEQTGKIKKIYTHPYDSHPELKSTVHQWGMTIDLNSCSGCSACVIACQSENNIPIVGRDQVAKSREMHWMRIDRYYTGRPFKDDPTADDEAQAHEPWIDDPQMVNQPMLCQHCENAPCESVCPVNATVHDDEGLNVMVYNRCVGTRYCSNNCPYKVRRFNYFDFNKRPIEELYRGPLAKRPQEDLDLIELAKNPDVSVRMRGVMEKCTFCVQRIEQAKIAQKIKAGPTNDVVVPDGTIKTACQQVCASEAITFGNLMDKESEVSRSKDQVRNYSVLGFLDTRPRTTYLARVRNPNPKMPDYHSTPLSMQEYKLLFGSSPLEAHDDAHHAPVEEKTSVKGVH